MHQIAKHNKTIITYLKIGQSYLEGLNDPWIGIKIIKLINKSTKRIKWIFCWSFNLLSSDWLRVKILLILNIFAKSFNKFNIEFPSYLMESTNPICCGYASLLSMGNQFSSMSTYWPYTCGRLAASCLEAADGLASDSSGTFTDFLIKLSPSIDLSNDWTSDGCYIFFKFSINFIFLFIIFCLKNTNKS